MFLQILNGKIKKSIVNIGITLIVDYKYQKCGEGVQQPTGTGMEMRCNSRGPRHFVRSYVFLFLTTLLIEHNAEGYLGETLFEISRIHN